MGITIHKEKLTAYNNFELGINRKYSIGSYQISQLSKFLNKKTISSTFLYNDQSEYIVSLRAYPFWMANFFYLGEYKEISIGPFKASDTGVQGKELQKNTKPVLIATYHVYRKYNNFMDFYPYTKITAYIPYVGFRDLRVNEIMGKTINFYAQVDFDNGLMTIWLECNDIMIDSWETTVGIDINLNRTNGTNWARNMYLWGIKAVTGTGSLSVGAETKGADYGKAVKTGGDVGTGYISANQHHVTRGGFSSGINNLYNPTSIYLIYEREVPSETIDYITFSYPSLYGLPLNKCGFLASYHGFTKVGNIHLENFTDALDTETSQIESLLRSGVIL